MVLEGYNIWHNGSGETSNFNGKIILKTLKVDNGNKTDIKSFLS
jgi:hypothetical protein